MRRLIIACLAVAATSVLADTYRYVDPQGRTVISDVPPPRQARDVSRAVGGGGDNLPFATQQAAANFPVTLYTSAECRKECSDGRDALNKRGVPFAERMLQTPDDVEELKKLTGTDAAVPVLKVGKQFFRGFHADSWNNLLDLAGYPKTAAYGSKPSGGLTQ